MTVLKSYDKDFKTTIIKMFRQAIAKFLQQILKQKILSTNIQNAKILKLKNTIKI